MTVDILVLWAVAMCTWCAVSSLSRINSFKLRCKFTMKLETACPSHTSVTARCHKPAKRQFQYFCTSLYRVPHKPYVAIYCYIWNKLESTSQLLCGYTTERGTVHSMKPYGVVEVHLHSFLISALGCEASSPRRSIPENSEQVIGRAPVPVCQSEGGQLFASAGNRTTTSRTSIR